ncbi:PanC Panthothenate synthetase [Methylophilaceae bacterium]
MQTVDSIAQLRRALEGQNSVALVPTMGNLHAGHLDLVKLAKQQATCVVVSIFVNPLQFGANEDLANYPRTLPADCEKLQAAGADIVFVPTVAQMYPDLDGQDLKQSITVQLPAVANDLCGASRPGHFAGVATVVLKLFNLVQPQVAVFGKKDYQQLFVIREMVKQFNLAIAILAADTVREPSGLAMSSRNGYLSSAEKAQASQLHAELVGVCEQIKQQGHSANFLSLEQAATLNLQRQGWQVDYVAIRAASNLQAANAQDGDLVVLAAAKLGTTRLIDNLSLKL